MLEDISASELLSLIDSKSALEAQAIIDGYLRSETPPDGSYKRAISEVKLLISHYPRFYYPEKYNKATPETLCWILLIRKADKLDFGLPLDLVIKAGVFAELNNYKNISNLFNLKKLDFSNVRFKDVTLRDLNFTNVRLDETKFKRTTFINANFSNSKFYFTKFTDSNLNGANFSNATLDYFTFINTSCVGADFSNTDLSDTTFTNVNFTNANLSKANLTNTEFVNVDFTNADISAAQIDWSVLKSHKISGLKLFIPSRFDDATKNNRPVESVLYESLDRHIQFKKIPDKFKLVIINDLIRAIHESALSHDLKIKAFDVFHDEMYFEDDYSTRRGKKSPSLFRIFDKNINESPYQKLFRDAKEGLQKNNGNKSSSPQLTA